MEISTNSNASKDKKEEFKYEFNESEENDDEYEKTLEKDIENNCDLNVYVNKLELVEKSDSELLQMEKHEIIDFKNYQIQKLKAYIISLEKEKEDMIENFRNTTNVLIDKIKEMEFVESGLRPETPFIAKKLKTAGLSGNNQVIKENNIPKRGNSNSDIEAMNRAFFGDDKDKNTREDSKFADYDIDLNDNSGVKRCPHCQKEFPSEIFIPHTLDCMRHKIRCKKCNELIEEKNKKQHITDWRSKEKILAAINLKDKKLLQTCIDHGASVNKVIDEDLDDTILHVLCKRGDYHLIEAIISTELNVNMLNKNYETPLIIAINENNIRIVKLLVDLGADLSIRNSSDMSPLMIACQKGLVEIAKYLVDNKAEVNEKASISGMTPLTLCKDEELHLYLIKSGAKIQMRPLSTIIKK